MTLYTICRRLFNKNAMNYFSQTGEDIIIKELQENKKNGFYVEVGCHEPILMSNTFNLYLDGWNGLCIDANPALVKKFKKYRPNDVVLCEAVSDKRGEVLFYEFDRPAVNTIDEESIEEWKKKWQLLSARKVVTKTLDEILMENGVAGPVDLLSIDVEGHDLQVLKSLSLETVRPRLIVIEIHDFDLSNYSSNRIVQYLSDNKYTLIAFATMNAFFFDTQSHNGQ